MSLDIHNENSNIKPTTNVSKARTPDTSTDPSFAEVALRLGGASVEEAKRTGVVDTADDQVEALFAPQYKTVNSPIHRAIWDGSVETDLFYSPMPILQETVQTAVARSLQLVRKHRDRGSLIDDNGKISDVVLSELGDAGYWGLLVAPEYGGSGASMREFSKMITMMATIDPTVAGLASVHGCIGAVDPVRAFGSDEQKMHDSCQSWPTDDAYQLLPLRSLALGAI